MLLELKINVRAELLINMNVRDRLVKGPIGAVKDIEMKENEVKAIYLELDDKCDCQIRMKVNDVIANNNK